MATSAASTVSVREALTISEFSGKHLATVVLLERIYFETLAAFRRTMNLFLSHSPSYRRLHVQPPNLIGLPVAPAAREFVQSKCSRVAPLNNELAHAYLSLMYRGTDDRSMFYTKQ